MSTNFASLDTLVAGTSPVRRATIGRPQHVPPSSRAIKRGRGLRLEYWLLFLACMIVLLPVAMAERLLPKRLRSLTDQKDASSLLTNARTAAHRCAAIAFQG